MRKTLFILCLLSLSTLHAQQGERGIRSNAPDVTRTTGKTLALVVGISKYKNAAIPRLQYADKDAMAFRNYLVSTGVDSADIMLLLNEKATNGEFWANLNYLTEAAKQGDRVYIYFSGHGDVENKTVMKDAFLLPYDAPKCVYPSGAIAVTLLKSWLSTLSAGGIQVIFIADACRSGNLAGGREGMEAAASILRDKWQDEVKFLSCQPGEVSLEGKQWGGGRGLFSFELINGLRGAADRNRDAKVTVYEMNTYLLDKVHESALPVPQNPVVAGNMESVISDVDARYAALAMKEKEAAYGAIDVKGFDDALAANLGDSIKYYYTMFRTYLDSGNYYEFHPATKALLPSAWYYGRHIPDNKQTHLLVSLMKRNFSAAVMQDATWQLELGFQNRLRETTPHNIVRVGICMKMLRDILGDEKLRSMGFLAKAYFFQSVMYAFGNSKHGWDMGVAYADSSIWADPGASYAYFARGTLYRNARMYDTAARDYEKVIAMSPQFMYAYKTLGGTYMADGEQDKAMNLMKEALRVNPNYGTAYLVMGNASITMGQTDAAMKYLGKAATMDAPAEQVHYQMARAYAAKKDRANSMKQLGMAVKKGYEEMDAPKADPLFDFIRDDKGYKDLMK